MISRTSWRAAGLVLLACALARGQQPSPAPPESRAVAAAASFNGEAFTYTLQLQHAGGRHRCYALTYPSPLKTKLANNNVVPAEYYVPSNLKEGEARRPAMVCLHILNGNFELERMLCAVLAESGVPAILFKLPYYGERSPVEGRNALRADTALFIESLQQAMLDTRRTVDVLASRPEVDLARIGVTGISLGALLAASACDAEPRFQRACLILGGGDLRRIISQAREAHELREALARLAPEQQRALEAALDRADPLAHAAALRRLANAGRLMMINAAEDEVIPPDCTRRLAEAAGMQGKVIWLDGMGHYTALAALPRILNDTVAFFGRDLPPGLAAPPVPAPAELSPLAALGAVLQQVSVLLSRAPAAGRCHYVDAQAKVVLANETTNACRFCYVRGQDGQFHLLAGPLPELGTLNLGYGACAWMVTPGGKVLAGRKEAGAAFKLADVLDPEQLGRLQLAGGATAALAAAPEAFAQHVQVTDEPAPPGERVLAVKLTQKNAQGSGRLRLRRDSLTPLELSFSANGIEGIVTFRLWSLEAVSSPELYREPAGLPVEEVSQAEVVRRFTETLGSLVQRIGPGRSAR